MINKSIKPLLYSLSSSLFILASCAPQTNNDIEFVAENAHHRLQSNELPNDVTDAPVPPKSDTCTLGECEIPADPDTKNIVHLPDQVEVLPTKVIHTSEKHVATDVVDYHITRHIWMPVEIRHTVNEHRELLQRFFSTIVFH